MDFRQARSEYLHLRHAYRSGQIQPDQFEKQVNSMIVRSKGQIWMIGVKTGKWYRREGTTWLEDVPEIDSAEAAAVTQDAKSSHNQQSLKRKLNAVYAGKPSETAEEKTFRKLTNGFSAAFIVLLLITVIVAGLMMKGVIETPTVLSSLISSNDEDGIGSSDTSDGNTTLSTNLVAPENGVITISGNISLKGFLYTTGIQGKWLQRENTGEILEFDKNGDIHISSSDESHNYSGVYSFTDDHHIRIETDGGSVETEIWIDAKVLTLVINDIPLVYDRIE